MKKNHTQFSHGYFPNKTPNSPPNLFLKQNNQTDYITSTTQEEKKIIQKKRIDDSVEYTMSTTSTQYK